MHAWEQIQKTVDYIEEHLEKTMQVEELAEIAALSPFYYQRLFNRLVHKPVGEYIKLRRMAKSMEALRQSDKRILDIALELGFSTHEHFTKTFKKTFGMTPEEYRKNPIRLNYMTKPELLMNYALIDEGVPLITDGIVLEINRKSLTTAESFIGFEAILPIAFMQGLGVESGEDPLDTLWNSLHDAKKAMKELNEDGDELGVAYEAPREGFFAYFAGTKAPSKAVSQQLLREPADARSWKKWELPAGEYIVCSFDAENFEALVMDALYKAQQYVYGIWLPNHKIETEPFCIERYASHDSHTGSMEVWLKVITR